VPAPELNRQTEDLPAPAPTQTASEEAASNNRRSADPLHAEMRRIVEGVYGPSVRGVPGLEIGRAYLNAAKADFRYGGDLVDAFHYGGGFTSLAVVDISGHGIHAAMYAGLAKHALRAFASRGFSAQKCVRALNRLCIENSTFEVEGDLYATVFFGILAPDRRTLQYVSAGHEAAYIIEPNAMQQLAVTGPIIGLKDDDRTFHHSVVRLSGESIIVAVTDGFSEARNASGEFLGCDSVVDVVKLLRCATAERQAEALTAYAFEFSDRHLQDDVAALVAKVQK
jgi:phosphoserine phosphatase RsbU/P